MTVYLCLDEMRWPHIGRRRVSCAECQDSKTKKERVMPLAFLIDFLICSSTLQKILPRLKQKNWARRGLQSHGSCPRTPTYDHEEAANSLEFSSEDATTPGSPDELFLKDLNPCLTPFTAKTKSKEFEAMSYDSSNDGSLSQNSMQMSSEFGFNSHSMNLSKSSQNGSSISKVR
ncbi:hypothetical protein LWI29_011974 [Acer saccharum]|uniref:Uncharacterized protein n=1 Tax=Acer saccharum TaxID=4024 RepID=A0AA39W649_ACESA|nr:hypothetical protein LWI29_011974 [Acer saccharum]